MQEKAKEIFTFEPEKLQKVSIDEVRENTWNPKKKDNPEYQKVKRSIELNGLTQPIFVRENENDVCKYEVLDGAHRFRACKDLGYKEIYIYNEGEVPDALAKSFTIFHQVQVPFDEIELAPLVVELNKVNIELPYTDIQIEDFKNMSEFDFDNAFKDTKPVEGSDDDGFVTFVLKMTADQADVINEAIKMLVENENVSEGRALELLVADGLAGYSQQEN